MKTAVLIKQVPDTETKIVINGDKSGIDTANVKYVVSPYDEFAIEEAIQKGGETTVICMGPDRSVESIRTALAMGVANAIHIDTDDKTYDSFQTASALAKVIQDGGFDLVLCGKQAIDGDNAQVPQMIAELIGASQVMVVDKLEVEGDKIKATRSAGGGAKQVFESGFPAVIGCDKGLNQPRYASLPGIMKAKSKPVDKKSADELLGGQESLVQFSDFELPPERQAGKKIEGTVQEQAAQLVKLLKEEAKVL